MSLDEAVRIIKTHSRARPVMIAYFKSAAGVGYLKQQFDAAAASHPPSFETLLQHIRETPQAYDKLVERHVDFLLANMDAVHAVAKRTEGMIDKAAAALQNVVLEKE